MSLEVPMDGSNPPIYGPGAIQRYRSVGVETADPGKLLLMLYDAAIGFCKKAKILIDKGDMEGKGKFISKAQAIINEFIATLDYSVAPELCANLESLYHFMLNQLNDANINVDKEPLDVVIKLLTDLRNAWADAVEKSGSGPQIPGGKAG